MGNNPQPLLVPFVDHPPSNKRGRHQGREDMSMKKIAIAVALAVALGGVGFVTSADAAKAKAPFNQKRWDDCRKKVFPQRGYGPAYVTAVDQCYRGRPW